MQLAVAQWMKDFADASIDVAQLVGGLAALLVIVASIRTRYLHTIGRRRDRYERLARLAPGVQLSFFASVHGEPPAFKRTVEKLAYRVVTRGHPLFEEARADDVDGSHEALSPESFIECIFVDSFYYLQTISDEDGTVLAFSVTVRTKRFHPRFEAPRPMGYLERLRWRRTYGGELPRPLFRVRLGKTRFSELDSKDPEKVAPPHFQATSGVRMFRYSEIKYFGNPGHYLTYVFTASSAAPGRAAWPLVFDVLQEVGYHEWPYPARPDPDEQPPPSRPEPEWEELPIVREFRRATAITTYTAIHSSLWVDNFPTTFGPHGDDVRLLR